ncbi:MAG: GntR family transcriptional regulator [Pseudomonadota bacterium]
MKKSVEEGENQSACEYATAEIRRAILAGEFRPDQPLRQESLAKKLSISRMPVRDALRILETEGLVRFRPKYGFTVVGFGAADVIEAALIRYKLETLAMEHAILNLTDVGRETLGQALDVLLDSDDGGGPAHSGFHMALYEPCGMARLLALIEHNLNMAHRFLTYEGFVVKDIRQQDDFQHKQLVEAMFSGNYRLADALLYTHIVSAAEDVADQLKT